jgi:hypothetical protein
MAGGFALDMSDMIDMVENDFNVVKDGNSYLTVSEAGEDVYDSSLSVIIDEFNYMEIFEDD